MKRLYLLRHAKSSWDDPTLADQDRPLAPRGRKASKRIAKHVRDARIRPDLVVCSSSARTQATLERIRPELGEKVRIAMDEAVYMASPPELVERLRRVPDSVGSVMLIGHNPGLQQLALALAAEGADLDRLREKFPTGALATIDLGIEDWDEVGAPVGVLTGYVVPRELR